jgi:hypothetical protein
MIVIVTIKNGYSNLQSKLNEIINKYTTNNMPAKYNYKKEIQ